MKILMINGSLKGERSHSWMVANQFVEGVTEACEDAQVTRMDLGSMRIEHCTGCFCCWKVTPGQCAIKDDMEQIRAAWLESDMIILSFPLYFFGIPSKMKAMLDRMLPFKFPYAGRSWSEEQPVILDNRYDFSEKKIVLVSTCAHASSEHVYESVTKEFDLAWGPGSYDTIFCPHGEILELEQMKPILGMYLKKVKAAGAELVTNCHLSEETTKKVCAPLVPVRAVEKMMTGYWQNLLNE